MSATPSVSDWLRTLGEITGMKGLALNPQGVCAFTVDDTFDVVVEAPERDAMLYLYAPLLRLDQDHPEALYEQLLKLNYLGRQTRGAVFAINQRDRNIVLSVARPLSMLDEPRFFALMEDFLETAQHWWQHFNAPATADAPQEAPPRDIDLRFRV